MAQPLPRLRMNLDFMPSPVAERPGLLIRDPYHYSDATLIVPPVLIAALELFDGSNTELDLRETLVRLTGELEVGPVVEHLRDTLNTAGFLENETYERMRVDRHQEFAESPLRPAAHAGQAYPDEPEEFRTTFNRYFNGSNPHSVPNLCAIAAPHVSPEGGWESYRDAYGALSSDHRDRVFVILGTSHYGEPDHFGLTRKNFVTPLGETRTEQAWVEELAESSPEAVKMEDYCHATEHSIEFQIAFLQHLYGPQVRTLPILVGSFARSVLQRGRPEEDPSIARFLDALGELHARRSSELIWVLGVDMSHIGRRYTDSFSALAYQDEMIEVSARDNQRIARISEGDSAGFWELVSGNHGDLRHDDLRWCGSAPLYTFLKAVPNARSRLLRYQHWQIDPHSVVSFAAMAFAT